MKKLLKVFRKNKSANEGKSFSLMSLDISGMIKFIGILLWIGASVNIVMSFVYILQQSNLGAFVSMTMLISLFYLVFTSLASNFELMGRQTSKR